MSVMKPPYVVCYSTCRLDFVCWAHIDGVSSKHVYCANKCTVFSARVWAAHRVEGRLAFPNTSQTGQAMKGACAKTGVNGQGRAPYGPYDMAREG
jgi:hypothetical protein